MARVIGAAATLGAAAIAACFSTPRLRFDAGDGDGDATNTGSDDAALEDAFKNVDGNMVNCETDLFNGAGGGVSCGSSNWGTLTGSGSAQLDGGGRLAIFTFGTPGVAARCQSATNGTWTRFTVDIATPAASAAEDSTFVGFQSVDHARQWGVVLLWDTNSSVIGYDVVCDGVTVTTNPVRWISARHYVQIERKSTTELQVSDSSDNSTFSKIGSCIGSAAAFDDVIASLVVKNGTSGSSANAKFGSIEICK
jgi:hypothetical protein